MEKDEISIKVLDRDGMLHFLNIPTDMNLNLMEVCKANEIAVEAFLRNKIGFLDISKTIEKTLVDVPVSNVDTLARVVENDQLSRQIARSVIQSSA